MTQHRDRKDQNDDAPMGWFGIRISDKVNWYLGFIWWAVFVVTGFLLVMRILLEARM